MQQHFASVLRSPFALHKAAGFQAVYQFDGTVMLDLQPLGDFRDLGSHVRRQSLEREKELVLARLQSRVTRCSFAKPQEPANLVPELRQRFEILLRQVLLHGRRLYRVQTKIISYHDLLMDDLNGTMQAPDIRKLRHIRLESVVPEFH